MPYFLSYVVDDEILLQYYDWDRGWEHTNPKWYEHQIDVDDNIEYMKTIIKWLYKNIDNTKRHCRWVCYKDKVCVRFRYEKDYIWFRLTW